MITFTQLMEKRVGRQGMSPTPDDPLKQAVRAPGDVGKVERLQQMDKNKSKMTRVPDTAQRMAAAKDNPELAAKADEVLTDLGVDTSKVGSVRTPRNYRNPEQFARRIAQIGRKMNNVQSDRGLVDNPQEAEFDKEQPTPNDPAETRARMAKADLAGRDMVSAADKNFDDAIAGAQGPTLRDPITIDGVKVMDTPELRHGYQPSGVGVANKKEFDDEYMDALIGGILDPDLSAKGGKDDAILGIRGDLEQQNVPVVKNSKTGDIDIEVKDPSRRDVEAHSDQGEMRGELEGRAYLTPEVRKKQQELRDALVGQQSDKVQDAAFKFKDVSDKQVDKFIEKFGQARGQRGREGKMRLVNEIEARGGVDGERSNIYYGGSEIPNANPNKPAWKIPKEALYDDKGNKLPKGIVNMSKIDDADMKADIRAFRAKEMVRTYLKQGGINAYAMHEGMRSMLDMDLEHIKSLKAGGLDHPDNWVWASSDLNQLRQDNDLGPIVDKRVTDTGITGPDDGAKLGGTTQITPKRKIQQTFNDFVRQDPSNQEKIDDFKSEIGDPTAGRVANRGMFAPDEYAKLSQDEIDEYRAGAIKHFGFSDDMAKAVFPDKGRLSGNPLGDIEMGDTEDYEQYDQDNITNMRDQVMYRNAKKDLKARFPGISDKDLKAKVLQQFKKLPASAARDDVEPRGELEGQPQEPEFTLDV